MPEGLNENARNKIAEEYAGGAVHLLETTISDGDGAVELGDNSEVEITPNASVWTITHDNTAGTTELKNAEILDFGSPGSFDVNQIVIQSTDNADSFLIEPAPEGDAEITEGDQYVIDAGGFVYEIGGE